jgi:hypothetical protein
MTEAMYSGHTVAKTDIMKMKMTDAAAVRYMYVGSHIVLYPHGLDNPGVHNTVGMYMYVDFTYRPYPHGH